MLVDSLSIDPNASMVQRSNYASRATVAASAQRGWHRSRYTGHTQLYAGKQRVVVYSKAPIAPEQQRSRAAR